MTSRPNCESSKVLFRKSVYPRVMAKNLKQKESPLLREQIGDVLRAIRRSQDRTLREVSTRAQVSLGYLSEVERGQKEASSELLASICVALEVPLSLVLREVALRMAASEGMLIRDRESISSGEIAVHPAV